MTSNNKLKFIFTVIKQSSSQVLFNNCSAVKQSYNEIEYSSTAPNSIFLKLEGALVAVNLMPI